MGFYEIVTDSDWGMEVDIALASLVVFNDEAGDGAQLTLTWFRRSAFS